MPAADPVNRGDIVRHPAEGWQGVITREIGDGWWEAWENESAAPYAMPHSIRHDEVDIVVRAP